MEKETPVKWLIDNSKKQRFKMLILILGEALFSCTSIAFALGIKVIIDGATEHSVGKLYLGGGIVIGIILLQLLLRLTINYLAEKIACRLEISFRSRVFNGILKKKYDKINVYHSGELINRLTSDVGIVADGVTNILPTAIAAVTRLICAVIALIIVDWTFAVAFVIAGVLVFTTISLLRGVLKSLHKKTQETTGKFRSFMQECIENLLAVKVFSANEKIGKKASNLQEENYKIRMKRTMYSVLASSTYNFIFSAGYVFALCYGAFKIYSGIMTYGALSAVLQLVNNVQVPFASLSGVIPKYFAVIASTERLMEIENIDGENLGQQVDVNSVYGLIDKLVIDDVTFNYDRDKVLEHASLTVDKGDFVAITGSSGIGKSTLIKLLLGVYNLAGGSIYFKANGDNLQVNETTRPLFTYVPQGNMIFSGSIRDNIMFINSNADEETVKKALDISCSSDFIRELPNGLDTVVGESGLGLSEGQIQRIAVARAVLSDSPIILLDEATSALDEKTEKQMLDNIKALKDKTLIIITHRKGALSICNKVVAIENKKIVKIKG